MFVPQLVFEATIVPALLMTARLGMARAPPTQNCVRAGPSARMRRLSVLLPPMKMPGIRMLAPVPTMARVKMLMIRTLPVGPPPIVEPVTVSFAVPLTFEPAGLVSHALKTLPLIDTDEAVSVSVGVVAPLKVALLPTLVHVAPVSVDACH